MVTPAAKRQAVAHLTAAHEMSERRACQVIGAERMTVRYRSRRPDDAKLRERLVALARPPAAAAAADPAAGARKIALSLSSLG
jgi:hypothetical protein